MGDLPQALRGARNQPPQADDYLDQMLEAAADEIERLRAALKEIASMGDEDDEWDGRDKFHNARAFAKRALKQ